MGRPAPWDGQIELPGGTLAPPTPATRSRKTGRSPKARRSPEDVFAFQCAQYKLPPVLRQYRFAKAELGRAWRFDFAFPDFMVAVEIEGLVPRVFWEAKLDGPHPVIVNGRVVNVASVERQYATFGRHASIKGMKGDMEKYNTAALLGWHVLRFEQREVTPGHAIEMTQRVLAARGWRREGS